MNTVKNVKTMNDIKARRSYRYIVSASPRKEQNTRNYTVVCLWSVVCLFIETLDFVTLMFA